MADVTVLIARLRQVTRNIRAKVPEQIADMMYGETMQNFQYQAYHNDEKRERWRDRWGFVDGKMRNAERFLNYRKLDHRGNLKRSIKPVYGVSDSGRRFAGVQASASYAQAHNEGLRGSSGNSLRRPPSSTKPVLLGSKDIRQRQFMGIGTRTLKRTLRIYMREIRKLL